MKTQPTGPDTTLGTTMSDRRLEGQGAPANEEPDQSLACYVQES